MNEAGVDLDGALDWIAIYNDRLLSKLQAQHHVLSLWGPDTDRIVNEFEERLGHWVRGHDCWCFESKRYFGSKGLEIKEHRLVILREGTRRVTPIMAPI
jgi:hypothetical protein